MTKGVLRFSILFWPETKTNNAAKAESEWLKALIKDK